MSSSYLHYDIIRKLGEGGMGVVYLATDTRLNREVALKFLPKHIAYNEVERKRFEIEARSAAGLNHPNIAHVYAIEEIEDELFIALEYVDGVDLKDIIEEKKLSFNEKVDIALQIAEGLKVAHDKGIIHRDIKSRNIMIDTSKRVKIMDFGLAHLEGSDHITKTGTTLGTTSYMSPEQLRGEKADFRSDIWALGVVLYELFTGEMPFRGLHEPAVMYSITEEDPAPIDETSEKVPAYVRNVIDRCLEKKPENRYQNISEVITDLKEESAKSPKRVGSSVNSKITRNLLGGIAAVSLLILVFIFFQSNVFSSDAEIPEKRYLAVLPIENIGNNPEIQAICDGLAETFSFQLSGLEQYEDSYWVTPASEIRKENVRSASQANKIFGVNLAISSSIQTFQDSTRLIIELVDADNVRRLDTRQVTVHSDNLDMLELNAIKAMLAMLEIDLQPKIEKTIGNGISDEPKAYEYYLKGRASLQNDTNVENLKEAIDRFEQAVVIDPGFALAYAGLGEAYWREYEVTGDVQYASLAETALNRALSINDQLAAVQYLFGVLKSGTGNYEESIAHFKRALKLDPKYTAAYRGMASVFNEIGDTKKALETYNQVIDLKPEYWEGYKDLGVYYLTNGDFGGAISNFEEVVEITPNNSKALSNLGIAYYYEGKNDKAREMFEKSLDLDQSPLTASNLAGLYFADGLYLEAAKMYEIALKEFSNRYEIWGNYAAAVELSGNKNRSLDLYRTAIQKAKEQLKVNPNDPELLADLGTYYSDLGETSDAIFNIKKALEINDQNLFVRFRAVNTYENLDMRKEALEWITADMITDIEAQPELKSLIQDPNYLSLKEQLANQTNQ